VPLEAFQTLRTTAGAQIESISGSNPNQWRRQIRLNVEEIIFPNPITWMDDDDSISDELYVKRAFNEIRNRFTKWCRSFETFPLTYLVVLRRPLYASTTASRISLARGLAKLACLCSHFGDLACQPTSKFAAPALDSYTTVVARLLDGPEAEVTAVVRRLAYEVFVPAIRHSRVGDNGLELVSELVVRDVGDNDRGVRLNAGYVMR
jgi:hypothetical protein